ncbi:hypothetical protein ACFQL4_13170 [Halosimplex aquaticum]
MDFGFRNFGPGAALDFQVIAAIERKNEEGETVVSDPVWEIKPHEQPLHLEEGEFWSLISNIEEDWILESIKEYGPVEEESKLENPAMVNFYYTFKTPSGARVPRKIQSDRGDENLLNKIYEPSSPARRIELWRLGTSADAIQVPNLLRKVAEI